MVHDALDTTLGGAPAAPADVDPTHDEALRLPSRKFVRVVQRYPNGLVRFDFAVGWPDLSCELVLPQAMFDDFCRHNAVEILTTAPAEAGINSLPPSEPDQP